MAEWRHGGTPTWRAEWSDWRARRAPPSARCTWTASGCRAQPSAPPQACATAQRQHWRSVRTQARHRLRLRGRWRRQWRHTLLSMRRCWWRGTRWGTSARTKYAPLASHCTHPTLRPHSPPPALQLVRVPSHLVAAFTADAAPAPVHQVLEDGSVLALASAPAMGYSARFASSELRLQGCARRAWCCGRCRGRLTFPRCSATAETMPDGGALLDNGCLRAVLSAQGTLVSLQDLTQSPPRCVVLAPARLRAPTPSPLARPLASEVVPAGRHGNELALHEDVPFYWDAWDVFVRAARAIPWSQALTHARPRSLTTLTSTRP